MPEYLAPGVYVEEIELGPRPIEGVSTSTAGFVGVARRGPVNRPTLVTNIGEYFRFFGDLLDEQTYGDNRWLPYAVQGFFANGGQRAYVVRVANLAPAGTTAPSPGQFALTATGGIPNRTDAARSLAQPVAAGDSRLALTYSTGLAVGSVLRVENGAEAEFVTVTGFTADRVEVAPPFARAHAEGVSVMRVSGQLTTLARVPANMEGAADIRVSDRAQLQANQWVRLLDGPRTEFLHLGAIPTGAGLSDLPVNPTPRFSHAAGITATAVTAPATATTTLTGAVAPGDGAIRLAAVPGLNQGDWVVLAGNTSAEDEAVRIGPVPTAAPFNVPVTTPPRFPHNSGNEVRRLTVEATNTVLVAGVRLAAAAGLAADAVVMLEEGPNTEFVQLQAAPTGPDFDVTVTPSLRFTHASGTSLRRIEPPAATTTTTAASQLDATQLTVASTTGLAAGDVVELASGSQTEYARLSGVDAPNNTLTVNRPLRYPHLSGTPVRRLTSVIGITAGPDLPDPDFFPEPGAWGNEIRVRVQNATALKTTMAAAASAGDASIQLVTTNGIHAGTLLQLAGNRYASVTRVEGNRVFLEGGVPTGADIAATAPVTTLEFKLTIAWFGLEEAFDQLSPDPRHPRYFVRQVNSSSAIAHLDDLRGAGTAPTAADLPLPGDWYPGGGSDGLAGVGPGTFAGQDSDDADRRSGLFALLNAGDVSIVAVPGQTDPIVQSALIAHCESARYRFGVLDSLGGPTATLDAVQVQRSLFDSKYAALYYPWIQIFDTKENELVFAPPSGSVAGLYARTDTEVGVHKAPANAVLRQVTDLQFTIGKGQQDILNPRGINAIRAFPGRGIRVWGARTISSDSLWRYVNVRRLFNFLERSIDEGTQYAVFEPNDLPLWNRLKGSVGAFLRTVWRSGALQGAREEEAFFVKCGLGETMIQADIDAGRIIVLIGVAPVKPAEFVIFRIGQKPGGSEVSE
jgi:phage tail sheath protein FI